MSRYTREAGTSRSSVETLIEAARGYWRRGYLPVPAIRELKRPCIKWKAETRGRTFDHTEKLFRQNANADAIALICGEVGGGLLVLDFDDGGSAFDEWFREVKRFGRDNQVQSVVSTPSGGRHVYLNATECLWRNEVLARNEAGDVLIETRGCGGLVIAPPTAGYETLIDVKPFAVNDRLVYSGIQPPGVSLLFELARQIDRSPTR